MYTCTYIYIYIYIYTYAYCRSYNINVSKDVCYKTQSRKSHKKRRTEKDDLRKASKSSIKGAKGMVCTHSPTNH